MPARSRPPLLTAYLLMLGGRAVGLAFSPLLLAHAPLVLLALSPLIGNMVLVSALSSAPAYFAVAFPVSVAQALLGFTFGRVHGPLAVRWLVERGAVREARANRLLTFGRRAASLLVLVPGPLICTLAGACGARPRFFLPLMVVAQLAWTSLCRLFGTALLDAIASLRATVAEHAVPLTLLTASLVAAWHGWRKLQGRKHATR
jgi:membrane protein DedA with SNARE-associated domain